MRARSTRTRLLLFPPTPPDVVPVFAFAGSGLAFGYSSFFPRFVRPVVGYAPTALKFSTHGYYVTVTALRLLRWLPRLPFPLRPQIFPVTALPVTTPVIHHPVTQALRIRYPVARVFVAQFISGLSHWRTLPLRSRAFYR